MKRFQEKKAQQLVEFLFVAPFMIIILGILTEYAYALNINMTLTQGLKTVTSSIYGDIDPNMTESQVNATVLKDLTDYLSSGNIPVNTENNIKAGYVICGDTAIFMARYTYIPAFTLPNIYFKIMPDKFEFFATSAVPKAFLDENNYSAGIDSQTLDKVWSSTASFSSQDDFNASKKGIMKNTDGRGNMLFLVPTTAIGLIKAYALVDWNGATLKSGSNIYTLDTNNGNLYECSATACTPTGKTFLNHITTAPNSYYNIIFINDSAADLSTLSTNWIIPIGTEDLSQASVQGILKRALSLSDSSSLSIGNYDNINVSSYNFNVSAGNTYNMEAFGSMVFVRASGDDISHIIDGSVPSKTYNFGS